MDTSRARVENLTVQRGVPTPLRKRPSAAERERLIRQLRESCQAGRLSLDTFSARLELAYAAQSEAELADLADDLPEPNPLSRAVLAAVRFASRWTARLEAAWREPRLPRLMLPSDASVTIGRSHNCDCVLSEPTVSRQHALLRYEEEAWRLSDLGSTNGTRVNGWRIIDEVEVRPGDQVSFGDASYRLAPPSTLANGDRFRTSSAHVA